MWNEWISSPLFGIVLSILAFEIGLWLNRRLGSPVANPLLIAVILVILVLQLFRIPLESFQKGGEVISMMLAPATAALALLVYRQLPVLRENFLPVVLGCLAGSVTSMVSVAVCCRLLGLDEVMTASLLPKSVTTPIAMEVSASHGGLVPHHRGGSDPHRYYGRHLCPSPHPAVPCQGPCGGGSIHRRLQPRCRNHQSFGNGRAGGSHERGIHRYFRPDDSSSFFAVLIRFQQL